jgi:diguanylate cyclase (GGDEF)-like protein
VRFWEDLGAQSDRHARAGMQRVAGEVCTIGSPMWPAERAPDADTRCGVSTAATQRADPDLTRPLITGVRNPARLKAVADAHVHGHLHDPDLDAVVATLQLACASSMAVVNIVGADLQTYAAEIGVGAPCTTVADGLSFCAEVVDTGRSLAVADAALHSVYGQNPLVLNGLVGAYAGVPLIDDGVVLGSVSIFNLHARQYSPDVLDILRYQGRLAASVLALRRSARTDTLTGLPNRALYRDRLSAALARMKRHRGFVCVMYLDIDDFKTINDTDGHLAGDEVLIELGARLARALRQTDTVARLGGDEFVVLCEDLTNATDAETMAARIIAATNETWIIRNRRKNIAVSIGVALTDTPSTDPAALLHDADLAMYAAKRLPGSTSVTATTPRTDTGRNTQP